MEGFANEVEEGFPATGNNEAEEFGVGCGLRSERRGSA